MSKTLILVQDKSLYFFPYIKSDNIFVCNIYKELGKIEYQFMKKCRDFDVILGGLLGNWKNNLEYFDRIILFDMGFTPGLLKYVKKRMNKPVYLYLWNPVSKSLKMQQYIEQVKNFIGIKSYDKLDCQKYGLDFAPMLFTNAISLCKHEVLYDVFFLGYAKDRSDKIRNLYKSLSSQNLRCYFYLVDSSLNQDKHDGCIFSNKRMLYSDYLTYIAQSNAILDLVQGGQDGLSLRTMESLFLHKKLITSNKTIIQYDFYRPENIFVIGNENIKDISDFLKEPMVGVSDKVVMKYDIENWVDLYF